MKIQYLLLALALLPAACEKTNGPVDLDEAFAIEQPTPKTELTRVALNDTQKGYVREGTSWRSNSCSNLPRRIRAVSSALR